MIKKIKKRLPIQGLGIFVLLIVISGCVNASPEKNVSPAPREIVCKEPRRTMCTKEYRPVCGYFADGTCKTFSNACTACSHKEVVSYTSGPCLK